MLVVSRQTQGRILRRFVYGREATPAGLSIRTDPRAVNGGTYVATINDVDVFASNLDEGHAWLFSARALTAITFSKIQEDAPLVIVGYEPSSDTTGAIKATFRIDALWNSSPLFELQLEDPADTLAHG